LAKVVVSFARRKIAIQGQKSVRKKRTKTLQNPSKAASFATSFFALALETQTDRGRTPRNSVGDSARLDAKAPAPGWFSPISKPNKILYLRL
jgi:hypothetical protein